jgi:hypothetical protein
MLPIWRQNQALRPIGWTTPRTRNKILEMERPFTTLFKEFASAPSRQWEGTNPLCECRDKIGDMGAREKSLSSAAFVSYCFGVWFILAALLIFNTEHPYVTGLISLAFLLPAAFFLSVARVEPGNETLKYRRWFHWRTVSYSEIAECREFWVYGYIRLRHSQFPWRTIYFVRANASDSLFGLDKTVLSKIRARANL